MLRRSDFFLALSLCLLSPTKARADVAPADSCTSAGQSCTNAPPDYHTAGTCQASKCTRSVPGLDGGHQTMTYDCTLCVSASGTGGSGAGGGSSAGGAAATGGSAGIAGSDAGTSGGSSDSGCNCIVSPARAGGAMATLMLVAGAVALLVDRRSRRN